MKSMLEQVGLAIERASGTRSFGLYDYTNYLGEGPPHVVRNELTGERVLATWDKDEAWSKYEECRRHYVADAAIKAMDQWRFEAAGVTNSPADRKGEA